MKSVGKSVLVIGAILVLVYMAGQNYLLFHGLTEMFSIVIAFSIFIISQNTLELRSHSAMDILGIGYLAIGFLDLLHTLAYDGMGVFTDYDYYGNQLWIATRFGESIILLTSLYFLVSQRKSSVKLISVVLLLFTATVVHTIFISKIFPVCFIEGVGLTPFKVISEYVIVLILFTTLIYAIRYKKMLPAPTYGSFIVAIIFTIIAELAFTFYISNYGISNMIGHIAKVFSFYFIYKGLVESSLKKPYQTLFKELHEKNLALEQSLKDVQQLQGLIPMCAWCHKVREDSGYWENVEEYLSHIKGTEITHGICPDCARKLENGEMDIPK